MFNHLEQNVDSVNVPNPQHKEDPYVGKKLANLVTVRRIDMHKITVTYNEQGLGFFIILWLISLIALLKNGIRALIWKATTHHQTPWLAILWAMGRSSKHVSIALVDGLSRYNHQAKTDAASLQALDLFYNYPEAIEPQLRNNIEGKLTRFWIGRMHNRQAVAIRLQMASILIAEAILKYQHKPVVHIVSIAAGSAQAVIQGILLAGCSNVYVVLLDNSQATLDAVRAKVEAAGLQDMFSFIHGTTRKLESICNKYPPHIIEMMGFLDYRPDKKARQLIQRIHGLLAENGTFFTCNIHPNPEKIFLDWVLLWPMIYRNEEAFSNLLIEGYFSPQNIQLYYDPFQIHGIAVCRK